MKNDYQEANYVRAAKWRALVAPVFTQSYFLFYKCDTPLESLSLLN